jgi:hypothetical protein
MIREPLRKGLQFFFSKTKIVPGSFPSTGWAETRKSQFCAKVLSERIKGGDIRKVQPCQNRIDTEGNFSKFQLIQCIQDPFERSLSSDQIIRCRTSSVQADLEVYHLSSSQEVQGILIQKGPIGANTGDKIITVTCIQDR